MAKNTTKTSTKSAPSQLLFESTWFVYTDNNRGVHTEFAGEDYCITMKCKAMFVHAATVRHICGDLPVRKSGRKSIYKLSLKENEEIIASM